MTLDEQIKSGINKAQNFLKYEGDRQYLKTDIAKTVAGAVSILALNSLNAPDLIETVAYVYTAYQGFKTYKDLQRI